MKPPHPLLLGLLLGLLLASCRTSDLYPVARLRPERTELASNVCTLPAEFRNGHFVLPVMINGHGPFRLALDTGTNGIVLSPPVAKTTGVADSGPPVSAYAIGGNLKQWPIRIDQLECGGMTLLNLGGMRADNEVPFLTFASAGPLYDGFIGPECFHDLVLEMDYPHRRLVVSRPGARVFPADRSLPYSGSVPRIRLTIDGKERLVAIDNGSNETLGLPDLAKVVVDYPLVAEDGYGTLGAAGHAQRRHFSALKNDVTAGPFRWHDMLASDRPDAAIGYSAFSDWSLVLDPSTKRVYFLGTTTEVKGNPAPPGVLGYYCAFEGRSVRILDVTIGGFMARVGFRPGDLITSVNGMSGAAWALDCDRHWVFEQGEVIFEIDRNGAQGTFVATIRKRKAGTETTAEASAIACP